MKTMETNQKTTNNTSFEAIAQEMIDLHERKNHDYGNAFGQTYRVFAKNSKEMANGYALGLIRNKVNRLLTLMSGEPAMVNNESIEDSLIDLASYSIMTLSEIRWDKQTEKRVVWRGNNLREVIDIIGRDMSAKQWSWEYFEEVVKKEGLKVFTKHGSQIVKAGDTIIKTADDIYIEPYKY